MATTTFVMDQELDLVVSETPQGRRYELGGITLHSVRAPQVEAQRWVQLQTELNTAQTVFLVGDFSGHISSAIKQMYPDITLVVLTGHQQAAGSVLAAGADSSWHPHASDLADFLNTVLARTGPCEVKILVWPPFERAVPNIVQRWMTAFAKCFRIVQGSWLTRAFFIERSGRNAIRNLTRWKEPFSLVQGGSPIVVAASGSSLEASLPWLVELRPHYQLWALPSSLDFLIARGLNPDFAVVTDAGWYTRELVWKSKGQKLAFLCGLGSAPDVVLENQPREFFSQGEVWENLLSSGFPGLLPSLPSQGTVAVSAINLAVVATTGPVLLAGMDLVYQDLKSHPNPHPATARTWTETTRLAPFESQTFAQIEQTARVRLGPQLRTSPAMQTYSTWLDSPGRFLRTIFRVKEFDGPSWASMQDILPIQARQILLGHHQPSPLWHKWSKHWPTMKERGDLVLSNLDKIYALISESPELAESLAPAETQRDRQIVIARQRITRWKASL